MTCDSVYMVALAPLIQKIRLAAGVNPNRAAKRIGISRTAYIKWESGDTANMKLDNLMAFCRVFRVDLVELLCGRIVPRENFAEANQPSAPYGAPDDIQEIGELYRQLPPALRAQFTHLVGKVLFELSLKSDIIDPAWIARVIRLAR